jgi:hypothetical protein
MKHGGAAAQTTQTRKHTQTAQTGSPTDIHRRHIFRPMFQSEAPVLFASNEPFGTTGMIHHELVASMIYFF